ncbi:hypothetical protein ABRP55_13870 [Pectobacterium zantedeschiae]|uniref:hypothetical protein n=1 Tax=Pectobacterium zantedeschiae TaxID=2034769 RepID=UPI0032EE7EDC
MTNKPISEVIAEVKAAAESSTALNLDSAQLVRDEDGCFECPVCCGEGSVDAENDYCNIDGAALGVQFYGIGEEHVLAEKYFRSVSPSNITRLIDHIAALEQQLAAERARVETMAAGLRCVVLSEEFSGDSFVCDFSTLQSTAAGTLSAVGIQVIPVEGE